MRMKKVLLIVLSVILYVCAVLFCLSAKEAANLTYLLLSEPIDAARAEDIFTKEADLVDSIGFCFWGERENQWVSCKETGCVAEVLQVLLLGNPGLLDAEELTWRSGCYLDDATALTLFGTSDCSEQTVWYLDRAYRSFDTIYATQPTMLAIAEASDGLVLNRCVLNVSAETGKQSAQQFLLRWGLAGEVIDYYALWVAVYDYLLLLPLYLTLKLYFCGKKRLRSPGKRMILLLIMICSLVLLGSRMRFLPDMFPSRWSEFSFWGNWWGEQRLNFQLVLRTPMGERHLQMMMDMVKSILSSTAAILLTMWTLRRQRYADTAD